MISGFQSPNPEAEHVPPVSRPKLTAGLLTKALSSQELVELSPGSILTPYVSECQLQLLRAAEARYAVFADNLVKTSYMLAARFHKGQARRNGDPVLVHCLETALILAELGLPAEMVAGGMLHDVLSDTPTTSCQLEEYLPGSVVQLVEKVTKISTISQLYRDNTHTLEAEKVLDMITTMSDVSAVLIKLADRLHNMRTISNLPRCKQVRMASETMSVFVMLANRLGAGGIKAEMEDLCFRILHPEEYKELERAVAVRQNSDVLIAHLNELKGRLEESGIAFEDISGRLKSLYGIYKKLQQGTSLERVFDVTALRIVVADKHDCYRVLREVQSLWQEVPGRLKDYIKSKKANGYQSLHNTFRDANGLPFEVQIRTSKMHYIAEYGFAAHWRYKECLGNEGKWLDRLVHWKKWVATEKLKVRDKKLRPVGSPEEDTSLACLNPGLLPGIVDPHCGHPPNAEGAMPDPFLLLERFRLAPPELTSGLPTAILLRRDDEVEVLEVGSGCSINDLVASGVLGACPLGDKVVMIHGSEIKDGARPVQAGDVVSLAARPSSPHPVVLGDTRGPSTLFDGHMDLVFPNGQTLPVGLSLNVYSGPPTVMVCGGDGGYD